MPEPQLSVRGADVIELAHRLAKQEGRTVRAVVTDALRAYEAQRARDAARTTEAFWADLRDEIGAGREEARRHGAPDESEDDLYDEDGLPA